MSRKTVTGLVITVLFAGVGAWTLFHRLRDAGPSLTPGEAEAMLASGTGAIVLDVRSPEEYRGPLGHIRGSMLLPLPILQDSAARSLDTLRSRPIIVYCRGGNRSAKAASFLRERGFTAYNMTGGILRWTEEHRPVELEENR